MLEQEQSNPEKVKNLIASFEEIISTRVQNLLDQARDEKSKVRQDFFLEKVSRLQLLIINLKKIEAIFAMAQLGEKALLQLEELLLVVYEFLEVDDMTKHPESALQVALSLSYARSNAEIMVLKIGDDLLKDYLLLTPGVSKQWLEQRKQQGDTPYQTGSELCQLVQHRLNSILEDLESQNGSTENIELVPNGLVITPTSLSEVSTLATEISKAMLQVNNKLGPTPKRQRRLSNVYITLQIKFGQDLFLPLRLSAIALGGSSGVKINYTPETQLLPSNPDLKPPTSRLPSISFIRCALELALFSRNNIPSSDKMSEKIDDYLDEKTLRTVFSKLTEGVLDSQQWRPDDWRKKILLKRVIKLVGHGLNNPEQVLNWTRKLEQYYARFFSPRTSDYSNSLLTRSGVSANAAAMDYAIQILKRDSIPPKIFFSRGWYYENENNVAGKLNTPSVDNANVFCLCLQSNAAPIDVTPEDHTQTNYDDVRKFLNQAKKSINDPFFLIIDKTTDLLDFTVEGLDLPDNVTVLVTASLTKHQRGAVVGTYGVVVFNDEKVEKSGLEQSRTGMNGEVPLDLLVTFPRPRAKEIMKQLKHIKRLQETVDQVTGDIQNQAPAGDRWSWRHYNYFSFLVPPPSIRNASSDVGWSAHLCNETGKYCQTVSGIEVADSFGLNTTRVATIPSLERTALATLRISYGRKTSTLDIADYIQMLITHAVSLQKAPITN